MAEERLDRLERLLANKIEWLSERATTAEEVEALAAVVQAFANFRSSRT